MLDSSFDTSNEDTSLGHYDEIALEQGEMEKAKLAVREIKEQFQTSLVHLDEDRNLVAMNFERWRDEERIKHYLLHRLGRLRGSNTRINRRSTTSEDGSFILDGRQETLHTRVPTPPAFSTNPKFYRVGNVLKVWIYEGDILKSKVDAIVCPADTKLKPYGQLESKIAKAAGPDLEKQKKEFIKQFKELKKQEVKCVTKAGKLDFKAIIHIAGLKWKGYKPHEEANIKECESDLFGAVNLSLAKAEELGHKSIGLPAIGAGNGKLPHDLCCVQYAQAVIDFSAGIGPGSSLKEIHFCDSNHDLVTTLQQTFDTMVTQGKNINYDRQVHVVSQRRNGVCSVM